MHNYSIDTKERIFTIFKLAFGSIIFVILIKSFFKDIPWVQKYLSTSSVSFTIFGILYALFDKFLWKWKWLRFVFSIHTPIILGEWEGNYTSSYGLNPDGSGEGYKGVTKVKIKQTWSKISIRSFSEGSSKSCSQVAGIFIKHPKGIVLKYEFENEPDECFNSDLNKHSGFESLVYDEDTDTMYGTYYTDKYRKTYGFKEYKKIS